MSDPVAVYHQINGYVWNSDRQRPEVLVSAVTVASAGGPVTVVNGYDNASVAVADFAPSTIHAAAQAWAEIVAASVTESAAEQVGPSYDGSGAVYTPAP